MRVAIPAVVLGAVALTAFLSGARPASACFVALPSDKHIGNSVERSPIIAIGRFEDPREHDVTFVVEQEIQGAAPGTRLPVDNRTLGTAYACSPYDEPFAHGYRYPSGMRAVLMLEKQVGGLWQVSHMALASFEVPETLDAAMRTAAWGPGALEQTNVRLSTILQAAGRTDFSLESPVAAGGLPFANSGTDADASGANWFGLSLGALIFAVPIAWRLRSPGGVK